MKKLLGIVVLGLLMSGNAFAEKQINFLKLDDKIDFYQTQAISFGLFNEISDTLKTYIQDSHVPFMFENEDSKINFLPDKSLENILNFKAVSVDLNNDGVNEVIAYMSGNIVCGSSGCTSYILQGSKDNWRILGEFFPGGNILISANITNNFNEIFYEGSEKYLCKFINSNYRCK